MPKTNAVYCDANIFLAYFNAEEGRIDVLDELFEDVQKNKHRGILTSVLTITEVSHIAAEKNRSRLDEQIFETLEAFWNDGSLIEFIELNELIARQARDLIRQAISLKYALRTNDAIHLASAKYVGASEFLTYDQKLPKFAALMDYPIVEPYPVSAEPPLNFTDASTEQENADDSNPPS